MAPIRSSSTPTRRSSSPAGGRRDRPKHGSKSTRLASGAPWTPLNDTVGVAPKHYADQSLVNSRRLPWTENTDVAIRWAANVLIGFSAVLTVTNLFDERGER